MTTETESWRNDVARDTATLNLAHLAYAPPVAYTELQRSVRAVSSPPQAILAKLPSTFDVFSFVSFFILSPSSSHSLPQLRRTEHNIGSNTHYRPPLPLFSFPPPSPLLPPFHHKSGETKLPSLTPSPALGVGLGVLSPLPSLRGGTSGVATLVAMYSSLLLNGRLKKVCPTTNSGEWGDAKEREGGRRARGADGERGGCAAKEGAGGAARRAEERERVVRRCFVGVDCSCSSFCAGFIAGVSLLSRWRFVEGKMRSNAGDAGEEEEEEEAGGRSRFLLSSGGREGRLLKGEEASAAWLEKVEGELGEMKERG